MDEYVINSYGIAIKKCCASCKHKLFYSDDFRACEFGATKLKPTNVCKRWEQLPKLSNAGKGDGRIRKKRWLMHLLESDDSLTLQEKIKAYENVFGSRFINT
jgi:hypothetical protein